MSMRTEKILISSLMFFLLSVGAATACGSPVLRDANGFPIYGDNFCTPASCNKLFVINSIPGAGSIINFGLQVINTDSQLTSYSFTPSSSLLNFISPANVLNVPAGSTESFNLQAWNTGAPTFGNITVATSCADGVPISMTVQVEVNGTGQQQPTSQMQNVTIDFANQITTTTTSTSSSGSTTSSSSTTTSTQPSQNIVWTTNGSQNYFASDSACPPIGSNSYSKTACPSNVPYCQLSIAGCGTCDFSGNCNIVRTVDPVNVPAGSLAPLNAINCYPNKAIGCTLTKIFSAPTSSTTTSSTTTTTTTSVPTTSTTTSSTTTTAIPNNNGNSIWSTSGSSFDGSGYNCPPSGFNTYSNTGCPSSSAYCLLSTKCGNQNTITSTISPGSLASSNGLRCYPLKAFACSLVAYSSAQSSTSTTTSSTTTTTTTSVPTSSTTTTIPQSANQSLIWTTIGSQIYYSSGYSCPPKGSNSYTNTPCPSNANYCNLVATCANGQVKSVQVSAGSNAPFSGINCFPNYAQGCSLIAYYNSGQPPASTQTISLSSLSSSIVSAISNLLQTFLSAFVRS